MPLYFEFIQFCCYLNLAGFLVFSIFAMIQNSKGKSCIETTVLIADLCQLSSVTKLSLANQMFNLKAFTAQSWVNLICVAVLICLLHLYRRQQRLTE